jgi:NAD(P)-dependent dehydrogenase (short-subunit alcohol dehydrogenase family)
MPKKAPKRNIRQKAEEKSARPPQVQKRQPGLTKPMKPAPLDKMEGYTGSGKLAGKVAIITGGDSGIGRAVSIAFAKEGADIAIVYFNEKEDAETTKSIIEKEGRRVILIKGDIGEKSFCEKVIKDTIVAFNNLNILVNNAAEQVSHKEVENISEEELVRVFRTNIFSMFFLVQAALPFLGEDSVIINTTSVTAYKGHDELLDYSATKGAIVTFTRSLARMLADRKIRVNAVAPGPIWTPLIPSTFSAEKVKNFGKNVPMGRAGQPDEVAPAFVFLASEDSSYITGQVIHVNGGTIVNS